MAVLCLIDPGPFSLISLTQNHLILYPTEKNAHKRDAKYRAIV